MTTIYDYNTLYILYICRSCSAYVSFRLDDDPLAGLAPDEGGVVWAYSAHTLQMGMKVGRAVC